MGRKNNYQLSEDQLAQVEQAIAHDPRADVVRRATAIRLLHQGHKTEEVAQMVAASRSTIQNWAQRWRAHGLEGLANRPKPGRRPKANATYRQVLESTLERDPHSFGYAFSVWTLERLCAHLERETGILLSPGRLPIWLDRWGYVYRRPKTDLSHKQDAALRDQVAAWLAVVKKQPSRGIVAFSLWTKQP